MAHKSKKTAPAGGIQVEMLIPDGYEIRDIQIAQIIYDRSANLGIELGASIKGSGLLQFPVLIDNGDGTFNIVFGLRRVAGAEFAGKETIRCMVFPKGVPTATISLMRLIENGKRSFNPAAEAEAIADLMRAYGWKEKDVAEKLSLQVSFVRSRVRLLDLIPEAMDKLRSGEMKLSQAKMLVKLGASAQRALMDEHQKLTGGIIHEAVRNEKLSRHVPIELFVMPKESEKQSLDRVVADLRSLSARTSASNREAIEQAIALLNGCVAKAAQQKTGGNHERND